MLEWANEDVARERVKEHEGDDDSDQGFRRDAEWLTRKNERRSCILQLLITQSQPTAILAERACLFMSTLNPLNLQECTPVRESTAHCRGQEAAVHGGRGGGETMFDIEWINTIPRRTSLGL
jgi:hypothetical protein